MDNIETDSKPEQGSTEDLRISGESDGESVGESAEQQATEIADAVDPVFNEESDGPKPSPLDAVPAEQLHGATLWLPCLEALFGLVFPMLVAIFFVPFGLLGIGVLGFAVLSAGHHLLRYLTFRYQVTDHELVLYSGIIHRRERRIPFDRVQETQIHQGFLYRLLDLAKLEITTAGSDVKEATLNVVTREAAECVRAAIGGRVSASTNEGAEPDRHVHEFEFRLSNRELLLGGLTSNLVASIGAVIAAIIYFQSFMGIGAKWMGNAGKDVEEKIGRRIPGEWPDMDANIPDLGPMNHVVDFYLTETLSKSLALAAFGLVGSVLAYVIRYHGFRLTRSDHLISTSYGLLALHRGSLCRDRIQTLKLEEGLLRRYFSLAAIRVDSAGDRQEIDEAKKRQVLVPVARREDAHEVAKQAIPGLTDLEPDWRRVSRLAIMRGSKKGWLIVALIALQTYGISDWFALAWLPAIPLVYLLNQRWYRHTGYWLGEQHFLHRKGWLNRSTVCLPIKNIQNVQLTQSYFDRRLDLATLSIDTAGQSNTGGGPVIRHIPIDEATKIQATLAIRVGNSPFTW